MKRKSERLFPLVACVNCKRGFKPSEMKPNELGYLRCADCEKAVPEILNKFYGGIMRQFIEKLKHEPKRFYKCSACSFFHPYISKLIGWSGLGRSKLDLNGPCWSYLKGGLDDQRFGLEELDDLFGNWELVDETTGEVLMDRNR